MATIFNKKKYSKICQKYIWPKNGQNEHKSTSRFRKMWQKKVQKLFTMIEKKKSKKDN